MRALAVALVLALSLPARAVDCSQQPDPIAGHPISEDQLRCLQVAIVTLRYQRDEAQIEAVKQAQIAAACEATASIACPKPRFPVVEVTFAALGGFVAGAVVVLVAFLAPR